MTTILTGLKPTGDLTLGYYIGAIRPLIELQNDNKIYLFVADLHALTVPQDREELKERIRKFVAMYIACGIDPNKVIVYIQSENAYIPAISWLLECTTQFGEASRMIQFKEKSKQHKNFSVGLLTYPVLMAADILYCDADVVPVGIDQKQHVEIARTIAQRFNNKYGETFTLPEALVYKQTTAKIKDLKDPTKKMSKTEENPQGVISLFDDEESITKKIMKATTDSDSLVKYDPDNKPGISNLLAIASSLTNREIKDIEEQFKDKNYGEFKKFVAESVNNALTPIKEKYNKLLNSEELNSILDKGKDESIKLAKDKYLDMLHKMGLER